MGRHETDPVPQTWDCVWAFESESAPNFTTLRVIRELFCGDLRGKKILEVGCGRACDSIELARLGARSYGVDFSDNALTISRELSLSKNAIFLQCKADANNLPFPDNSFDLVFSQGLVEHFKDPGEILSEQVRVAKKGGYVLVDVPQTISIQAICKTILMKANKWPFGWERNYTEEQLIETMQKNGLVAVDSYAWGYMPILRLGIRTMIKKYFGNQDTGDTNPERTSYNSDSHSMWRFQKSWVGKHAMNCLGVMGQK